MKHENINTLIALAGLLLAAITALSQFKPPSDQIEVVSEGIYTPETTVSLSEAKFYYLDLDDPLDIIGPINWKLRLSNQSAKPVSVVSYKVFLLTDENTLLYYSGISDKFRPYPEVNRPINLPINIQPYESIAVVLSLNIPVKAFSENEKACLGEMKIRSAERCLFGFGRDLLGNDVTINYASPESTTLVSVSWDDSASDQFGYDFLVKIQTADESDFGTRISYDFSPSVE